MPDNARQNHVIPRIVIVGGGFGGLEVAKALGEAGIRATIVDRQNRHLFQPLLYQVATAALSAADVAEPIRKILGRHRSIQVIYGEVERVDMGTRRLLLSDRTAIAFDLLVLATGSRPFYIGREDWAATAPGLKTIENARAIRSRLLLAFEHAERTTDPEEQRRLMTFAVIGGGPTGVEIAGSIAELSRHTLVRDFRNIRPERTRILLVEAGDRILGSFVPELSEYAQRGLEKLGVEVVTGKRVDAIGDQISIEGDVIPVGLTLWAAGVAASPLAGDLGVDRDRGGRVAVDGNLQVVGCHGVFALGDVALCRGEDGQPLPGLAQVAKQQGIYLGKALAERIRGGTAIPPFVYRSRGNTAIVGRHARCSNPGGSGSRAGLRGSLGRSSTSTSSSASSIASKYRSSGCGATSHMSAVHGWLRRNTSSRRSSGSRRVTRTRLGPPGRVDHRFDRWNRERLQRSLIVLGPQG